MGVRLKMAFITRFSSLYGLRLPKISLPDGKKFLFIDSISTIAMYVSKNTFAKFSHFLASKLREHGAMGIVMSGTKDMDEEIKQTLNQFCDRVIDLTKGER